MKDLAQKLAFGATMLAMAVVIVSSIGGIGASGGPVESSVLLDDGTGTLDPGVESSLSVQQSLGTGLQLSGNGSSFSSPNSASVDQTYSLCSYTAIDAAATARNQTIAIHNGEIHLQYAGNRSNATWVGTFYDPGTSVTYDVAVPADSPTNRTHLCLQRNESELTLHVNGTDSATATIDGSHTVADGGVSGFGALDGWVEETRLFDAALSASARSSLRQEPTSPLSGHQAVARVMYDDRGTLGSSVSSLPVYFTSGDASVTNGTIADGFAGAGATAGTDYRLADNGFTLVALNGGTLDGAPVAFVDYESYSAGGALFASVVNTFYSALRLGAVALVVLVAGFILRNVRGMGKLD